MVARFVEISTSMKNATQSHVLFLVRLDLGVLGIMTAHLVFLKVLLLLFEPSAAKLLSVRHTMAVIVLLLSGLSNVKLPTAPFPANTRRGLILPIAQHPVVVVFVLVVVKSNDRQVTEELLALSHSSSKKIVVLKNVLATVSTIGVTGIVQMVTSNVHKFVVVVFRSATFKL
jgi:hypothetical protein